MEEDDEETNDGVEAGRLGIGKPLKKEEEMNGEKIRETFNKILQAFDEGGDNLEKVALAVFRGIGRPSDDWSFMNRIIMFMNGTEDARGFKQWKKVNRHIKKGAKAFYIFAPIIKKVKVEIEENDNEKTTYINKLVGFKQIPVFRYEDTEGEPLKIENVQVDIPYRFNGIIDELNLKIKARNFKNYYGAYKISSKEIELASPEMIVFLHELSHAVDDHLHGIQGGQLSDQEVVAEFSAAVIGQLMGYKVPLGNVKSYIEHYGVKNIFKSLNKIEKIVNFVIERTKINNTN